GRRCCMLLLSAPPLLPFSWLSKHCASYWHYDNGIYPDHYRHRYHHHRANLMESDGRGVKSPGPDPPVYLLISITSEMAGKGSRITDSGVSQCFENQSLSHCRAGT